MGKGRGSAKIILKLLEDIEIAVAKPVICLWPYVYTVVVWHMSHVNCISVWDDFFLRRSCQHFLIHSPFTYLRYSVSQVEWSKSNLCIILSNVGNAIETKTLGVEPPNTMHRASLYKVSGQQCNFLLENKHFQHFKCLIVIGARITEHKLQKMENAFLWWWWWIVFQHLCTRS